MMSTKIEYFSNINNFKVSTLSGLTKKYGLVILNEVKNLITFLVNMRRFFAQFQMTPSITLSEYSIISQPLRFFAPLRMTCNSPSVFNERFVYRVFRMTIWCTRSSTMIRNCNYLFNLKSKLVLLILVSFLFAGNLSAQSSKSLVREGNKLYKEKKYTDAEINYRKALDSKKDNYKADFNLADALYKEGKYDEAAKKFQDLSSRKLDDETTAAAYHNLGNSLLQSKKYAESIQAYKNSLKLLPKDEESKYNLEYARRMLQQEQQQQKQNKDQNKQDQNKQDQNKQDQNKQDQNKQDQNKQDQNKQDQNKQDQNKQDQEKQGQEKKDQNAAKQDKNKISKEDANRILQALNNEEKNVQKKVKRMKATKVKIAKNW